MAQQARPKVAGHTERARAQPATFSTEVSSTPLGSLSSRPIDYSAVALGLPGLAPGGMTFTLS